MIINGGFYKCQQVAMLPHEKSLSMSPEFLNLVMRVVWVKNG
jgi:hypothetical protein